MRSRSLWLLTSMAAVACAMSSALAAGDDEESSHKKKMTCLIENGDELRGKGEALKAHKAYLDAANINADKDLVKQAKGLAEELEQEAEDVLEKAKELSKEKEVEQADVTEMLCACFQMRMAWEKHPYAGQAAKHFKKLKRKLSKETKKEAESAAKEVVGEGKKHLKANDTRSALACYGQLYSEYAFTKEARKVYAIYVKLKAMVAELDRKEEEEREREEKRKRN